MRDRVYSCTRDIEPEKIRVAMLAHCPAQALVPEQAIKPRHRSRYAHPTPWVEALCRGLDEYDIVDVRVFVHSRAVTGPQSAKIGRATVEFIPKYETGLLDPFHLYVPGRLQIGRAIRRYRPHIVHAFGTESHNGWIASLQPVPSIIFIQGIMELLRPWLDSWWLRKYLHSILERIAIQRASHLVAETRFVMNWAARRVPQSKISIIPHAVRPDFYAICPNGRESRRLVSVSTLRAYKGLDTVIRAFSRAVRRYDIADATLAIVGDGPLRGELERLAEEQGVRSRVEFCGRRDAGGVKEELARSQVFVIGSRMDSSPNAVTEAHCASLPVIGTAAGGIPDMIEDGSDGFIVGVDDVEAMSERIAFLLRHPEACRKMGAQGYRKVADINNPVHVAGKYVELYERLLNDGKTAVESREGGSRFLCGAN